jgi:AcrR family transcriptional regulator
VREGAERTAVAEEGQPPSFAAYRLPPGKHGIPPEQVVENQRWRLLGAAAEALAERGYGSLRGADVCRRAGVSRETFYEHFDDLGDCLLAAYEMTADCVRDLVLPAFQQEAGRGERVRGALGDLLRFLAEEPALAHLLGPEAPAGVPAIAAARERLMQELVDVGVDRHRMEGALAILSAQAGVDADRLPALVDQLVDLIELRARRSSELEQDRLVGEAQEGR